MTRGVFVGLATLDVVSYVDRIPAANEKVTARLTDMAAGGPATNAAIAFAALGGEAILVSCFGDSPAARFALADAQAQGVGVLDCAAAGSIFSVSQVAVAGSARQVVGADASRAAVDSEAVARAEQTFHGADVVLFDGHYPQVIEVLAPIAAKSGARCVVDAGRWRPIFEFLLPRVDDVVASSDFAVPSYAAGAPEGVLSLAPHANVVVTRGERSVLWWRGRESEAEPDGRDALQGEVAPPVIEAIDTLAAGDVFHGAFALARGRGLALEESIELASAAASLRCTVEGADAWRNALRESA